MLIEIFSTLKKSNSGPDDEGRQHDDQLSTTGRTSQLLPLHHLQPGSDRGGRGLHAGGDGQAGARLVNCKVRDHQPQSHHMTLF